MLVYTSITKNYLPKARILAYSLKKFHPDWEFVLLYSDTLPENFDLSEEPFDEVLLIENLGIENWKSWAFKHNIVELCTAVKGVAAELLATRKDAQKIMYLDPDIKVFNSLSELERLLDRYDVLLTPHILDVEVDDLSIIDNEISALKHGIYNLGFFAAKTSGQGLEFIRWWADRLRKFCYDDIPNGLFTDQKWCDLAPVFFSNLHIVRDRGYNVATWNISHRLLSIDENGTLLAGGVPLRFYHFTGYDSGAGRTMLNRYAENQSIAFQLWDEYANDLSRYGQKDFKNSSWKYGTFDNGEQITRDMRLNYRSRIDLQNTFLNPYLTGKDSFLDWWREENKKRQDYKKLLSEGETTIVFFGASSSFKKALDILSQEEIYPDYVCDNDVLKQGQIIESYKVLSPCEVLNNERRYFVIITSSFVSEIREQLKKYENIVAIEDYITVITLLRNY